MKKGNDLCVATCALQPNLNQTHCVVGLDVSVVVPPLFSFVVCFYVCAIHEQI
jgi:hypothetical protein